MREQCSTVSTVSSMTSDPLQFWLHCHGMTVSQSLSYLSISGAVCVFIYPHNVSLFLVIWYSALLPSLPRNDSFPKVSHHTSLEQLLRFLKFSKQTENSGDFIWYKFFVGKLWGYFQGVPKKRSFLFFFWQNSTLERARNKSRVCLENLRKFSMW